ncbi:MAG: ankyrin repeat domain-containing protein [Phycisphaeraceae bacterium]|nr:ankyrin repeat domain-containing protein [Phycisphaeraceae bacterium]
MLWRRARRRNALAQGADASASERGRPLLHWAAQEGHAEICRQLLQHGADNQELLRLVQMLAAH